MNYKLNFYFINCRGHYLMAEQITNCKNYSLLKNCVIAMRIM